MPSRQTQPIVSSILANTAGGEIDLTIDVINGNNTNGATVTASANDLIQSSDLLDSASASQFTGTPIASDPMLGDLANNGSSTTTMRLLLGSPAIGMDANPNSLTTDQRGGVYARTAGSAIDIG